jgi:PAS domain S-box-containing protein
LALSLALNHLQTAAERIDAGLRSSHLQLDRDMDRIYRWSFALACLLVSILVFWTGRTIRARQRLDLRLAESEAHFRGLVEQSIVGICIIREGRIDYANRRTADIMGCGVADLRGKSVLEFFPAEDRESIALALAAMVSGEQQHYQSSMRCSFQGARDIEIDIQATTSLVSGERVVMAVVQDVSERQRLQRERLEALQLVESISLNSSDAIFAKDREGRYLLYNAEAERMSGKSAADAIGKDDRVIFPPQQAAVLMSTDQRVMTERRPLRYEIELRTVAGLRTVDCITGPLFDASRAVTGVFGIARDITLRKEQELALEESRAQLATVIDALDEGLVVISPEGEILRMNPAARRINGNPLQGAPPASLNDHAARVVLETLGGEVLEFRDWPGNRLLRGETVENVELVIRRIDRVWTRIANFNGTAVRATDGSMRFALLTFTDITLRKHAEATLLQTQRMESLGTLAAGIAHDFNNLLLAISGNAAMANAELPEGHAARESIAEIERAGRRASDLVKRILLFARADDARRQSCDLRTVVEEALALLRPTLPADIGLLVQLGPDPMTVSVDESQLHQVVVNLVTNAVYAIQQAGHPGQGEIRIGLAQSQLQSDTSVGSRQLPAGQYVCLTVGDNGCGMDATIVGRMFDPFFTTKPVGKGTGLGLPMVHGIVSDHDGAIEVTSKPDSGTRVDIYLPLAKPVPRIALVAEPERRSGQERRVLYVDDEDALVFLVTRYLRKRGFRVAGFSDPAAAAAEFAARAKQYDVVVTDLAMPGMSGFELARTVHATRPDVPIIMMSGFVRPEDRDAALASGVTDILLKPSTIDDLGKAIERQLA